MSMAAQGVRLAECNGPVAGADVRWRLPVNGLMLGATYTHTEVSAPDSTAGPYPFPIRVRYQLEQVYGQFEKGKFTPSGEWRVNPVWLVLGPAPEIQPSAGLVCDGELPRDPKADCGLILSEVVGLPLRRPRPQRPFTL